ncbi:MAG: DUF4214 domain-containing protein [Rhodobacteraceae bacterium]|nr:DUF4214 domain-containing protein [Paracoccaceae bacterium]
MTLTTGGTLLDLTGDRPNNTVGVAQILAVQTIELANGKVLLHWLDAGDRLGYFTVLNPDGTPQIAPQRYTTNELIPDGPPAGYEERVSGALTDAAGTLTLFTYIFRPGDPFDGDPPLIESHYMRRFDATGAPLDATMQRLAYAEPAFGYGPSAPLQLADGRLAIADNFRGLAIFNPDGTLSATSEAPATNALEAPRVVDLAETPSGIVMIWGNGSILATQTPVTGRLFDLQGNPVGAAYQINGGSGGTFVARSGLDVETLADGRVVATWQENRDDALADAGGTGVYFRILNPDGTGAGPVTAVNTTFGTGDQYGPQAHALDSGGFVITYQTINSDAPVENSAHNTGVMQSFDASGAPVGGPVLPLPRYEFATESVIFGDATGLLIGGNGFGMTVGQGAGGGGGGGATPTPDIEGTQGNDIIVATDDAELIDTGAGNDVVEARAGNDTVRAGDGNDTVWGEAGDDVLEGGAGDDELNDGPGTDTVDGGSGVNTLRRYLERDHPGDTGFTFVVDLAQGRAYSQATPAVFDTLISIGNAWVSGPQNSVLIGDGGNNYLHGSEGDSTLQGGAGNDTLEGSFSGTDTAVLNVARANAQVTPIANGARIVSAEGTDTLYGIERVQFSDGGFALGDLLRGDRLNGTATSEALTGTALGDTLVGNGGADTLSGGADADVLIGDGYLAGYAPAEAAQVYRLYQATLDRAPDRAGHAGWVEQITNGQIDLRGAAAGFVDSPEFQAVYGALASGGFVELLYRNVLGREADAAGLNGWLAQLTAGASRADVVVGFSESPEFIAATVAAAAGFTAARSPGAWSDEVFRAYRATLDRDPDLGGFSAWLERLADGTPLNTVIDGFVGSVEFQNTYGALPNDGFVNLLYRNVLNRDADAAGLGEWLARLDGGAGRADVVLGFSESTEFRNAARAPLESWMRAQAGDDSLTGGTGNDLLAGGALADRFVFASGDASSDRVVDFELWDTLELQGFGYADVAAVRAQLAQVGGDVVFSDQGVEILLQGLTLSEISDTMFQV